MGIITPTYIANFIVNLFIFILLACCYTYIQKLEDEGCKCVLPNYYANIAFIKNFSIFALIFLIFVMIIPPGTILADLFGKHITGLYLLIIFIFYIVFIIWIYLTMMYTRKLIVEKCKCSEDIRRELIFAGTTIEMVLILLLLLTTIVLPIVISSVSVFFNNAKNIANKVETNLKNPVKGIKNIPSDLGNIGKQVKNVFGKTAKGIKSLTKK